MRPGSGTHFPRPGKLTWRPLRRPLLRKAEVESSPNRLAVVNHAIERPQMEERSAANAPRLGHSFSPTRQICLEHAQSGPAQAPPPPHSTPPGIRSVAQDPTNPRAGTHCGKHGVSGDANRRLGATFICAVRRD
jgi:hypothetical protein